MARRSLPPRSAAVRRRFSAHFERADRLHKRLKAACLDASYDAEMRKRCAAEPDFPLARGCVHTGPVLERGSAVFGATVNLVARIASQAHGGQLLVSETVRGQLDDPDLSVVDHGAFEFRNLTAPAHLCELSLGLDGGCGGIDPVCKMRVVRDRAGGRLRHDRTDHWLCSLARAALFAPNLAVYLDTTTDRLTPQ